MLAILLSPLKDVYLFQKLLKITRFAKHPLFLGCIINSINTPYHFNWFAQIVCLFGLTYQNTIQKYELLESIFVVFNCY